MAERLLQTVSNMRTKLGYDAATDTDAAILSALEKATAEVRNDLRCIDFQRGTASETFLARNLKFGRGEQYLAKLKLSRGFVDETQTITARAAVNLKGLDEEGSYINLRANPENENFDHLLIDDAERGRIIIGDFSFVGIQINYIRIAYTCGFLTQGTDAYRNLPEWLIRLGEIRAELAMMHNPVLNPGIETGPRQSGFENARIENLKDSYDRILADHVCYAPTYAKASQKSFTAS